VRLSRRETRTMLVVFGSLTACGVIVPLLIGLPAQHFLSTPTYKLFGVYRFVDIFLVFVSGTCCAGLWIRMLHRASDE